PSLPGREAGCRDCCSPGQGPPETPAARDIALRVLPDSGPLAKQPFRHIESRALMLDVPLAVECLRQTLAVLGTLGELGRQVAIDSHGPLQVFQGPLGISGFLTQKAQVFVGLTALQFELRTLPLLSGELFVEGKCRLEQLLTQRQKVPLRQERTLARQHQILLYRFA